MKALHSFSQFLLVAIISFALITPSLEAMSQNGRNHSKSDINNNRKDYRKDHNNKYSQQHSKGTYQAKHGNFYHPKYGRVYQKFDQKPTIFRHSNGNYYYSRNQFYTYRDGIGYCVAEAPRHVYFRDLPFSCNRVRVNGQVYFRNGDLYFRHSPRGYVMVPSPVEVNLSVKF